MSGAPFELSLLAAVVVTAGAALGGVVQGVLGFGGAYVAVPVLAVVEPRAVPAAVLLGFAPFLWLLAWRDRDAIDHAAFLTISVARVPGIALGTAAVALAPTTTITLVVAACLLLAVVATVAGWELRPTTTTRRVVGAVSGFTGTAAALGGPPMALLYHRAGAADRRGTMGAIFAVGVVVSLALLALVGELGSRHVPVAGLVAAGLLAGSVVAPRLNRLLPDETLRRAVLAWAAVGALVAGVRALIG